MAGANVVLEDEIRLGIGAFQQTGQILELAAILALEDPCSPRSLERLDDDREAQFTLDQIHVHGECAQDRARDRQAGAVEALQGVQLVGDLLDRRRAVDQPHPAPFEMPQQGEREVVRLRPGTADHEVRSLHQAALVGGAPVFLGADHEVELVRMEHQQLDPHGGGSLLKTKDLRHFRVRGIEFPMKQYPATHGFISPGKDGGRQFHRTASGMSTC